MFMALLQIDENVTREIINHRSLRHPNIVRFKEVLIYCMHKKASLFCETMFFFVGKSWKISRRFTEIQKVSPMIQADCGKQLELPLSFSFWITKDIKDTISIDFSQFTEITNQPKYNMETVFLSTQIIMDTMHSQEYTIAMLNSTFVEDSKSRQSFEKQLIASIWFLLQSIVEKWKEYGFVSKYWLCSLTLNQIWIRRISKSCKMIRS